MGALIFNETKKLLFKMKTIVVFIAFILLLGVMAFGFNKDAERAKKDRQPETRIARLKNEKMFVQQSIDREKEYSKDRPEDFERFKQSREEELLRIDNEIKQLEEAIKSGVKVDWKKGLKGQIDAMEQSIKADSSNNNENIEMQKAELQKLKYMYDNNINPEEEYEFNSATFGGNSIMILGTIFLVVGVMVFASDIVSGECTPPTLKFLLVQPVSRGKVLFSKFISVVLTALVLIMGGELLYFLAIGLTKGFGNMNLPVVTGTLYKFQMGSNGETILAAIEGSSKIITMGEHLVSLFLYQGLYIVACTSFAFLLSTILKSSMISMAIGTVSVVIVTVLSNAMASFRKIAHLLFLNYGDVGSLLNGYMARGFRNPNFTSSNFMIVMVCWIIGCYLISHIVFTKKDILI